MTKVLLDIKSLPAEIQYKIWAREQRNKAIQDAVCVLLCVAMSATIVVKPINQWLDHLLPVTPKAAKPTEPQRGSWKTPVKAGDAIGKGLVAGTRGYQPKGAINPLTGQIKPHWGWDVGAPYGLPLYAVTQGKTARVECLYEPGGAGYYAFITPDEPPNTAFVTMHMAPGSCKAGVKKRGEIIGNVASTGASTGPHIHFEFRVKRGRVWLRLHPMLEQMRQHVNGN